MAKSAHAKSWGLYEHPDGTRRSFPGAMLAAASLADLQDRPSSVGALAISANASLIDRISRLSATASNAEESETDGILRAWSAWNLDDGVMRLDMDETYPVWVTEGATHENLPAGSWDGGPCAKLTPSSVTDHYAALGGFGNLHRGGALEVRQLNWGLDMACGSAWGAGNQSKADNKFIIIHAEPTNTAGSTHRPMLNVFPQGGSASALAVGCGTVKQFRPVSNEDDAEAASNDFGGDGNYSNFYWSDSAGSGGPPGAPSKPLIGPLEWVHLEIFVSTVAISGFPNGCIRAKVWRRDGTTYLPISIPYNYDAAWSIGDYINEVQIGCGGYANGPGGGGANDYLLVSNIRCRANASDASWLGPMSGF